MYSGNIVSLISENLDPYAANLKRIMLPLRHWWLCLAKNISIFFLLITLLYLLPFKLYTWTQNCIFEHDIYENCDFWRPF